MSVTWFERESLEVVRIALIDEPNGVQWDPFGLVATQLRNERQMWDLRTSPAELEDHTERNVVEELDQLRGGAFSAACKTQVERERKTHEHTNDT